MNFPERELPDNAEPISASDLRERQVYFAVNHVDDQMLIPVVETIVFVGRNKEAGDVGQVYFQDVESHREGVSYDWESSDGPAKFQSGSEEEISHIFDYGHALEVLMRCSLRRQRIVSK